MYHIEFLSHERLFKKIREHPHKQKIIADIDSLAQQPDKGKYLPRHDLYELRYTNLRIYYIVTHGEIIIFGTEYEGVVTILGKRNKN
jgi:hypothetical protein